MWTLLIVLSLLAACKQPQSLTPSVSEVAQIKAMVHPSGFSV